MVLAELVGGKLPSPVDVSPSDAVALVELVGGKLPVSDSEAVSVRDPDPDSVAEQGGGGGLGNGQVVMVWLITTVTGALGAPVRDGTSLPWWSPSGAAVMPEIRAETARSD